MGVRRLTGRVHTIVIPTRVSKAMENPVISKTNRRKCRSTEGANLTLPNPIGTVPASMGRRCCMGFGRTTCLTATTVGSSPMRWGCGVVAVVSVWSQSASATWCWRGVLESSGQVRVCVCVCVLQNVVFIYFLFFLFLFFGVAFSCYFLLFCIFIVFVCLCWVECFSVFLFTTLFLIFFHFLLFIYLFILTLA